MSSYLMLGASLVLIECYNTYRVSTQVVYVHVPAKTSLKKHIATAQYFKAIFYDIIKLIKLVYGHAPGSFPSYH